MKRFLTIVIYTSLLLLFNSSALFAQVSEYEEIGNKFSGQGEPAKAADYFTKAAFYYWNNGVNKKAVENFKKVLDYNLQINNSKGIFLIYNNLGLLYSDMEEYQNALSAFNSVLSLSKKTGNKQEQSSAMINVATSLQSLDRYSEAISMLEQVLLILPEIGDLSLMRKAYSTIAECHERIGNSTLAFEYYQKYSSIDKKLKKKEMEEVQTSARNQVQIANTEKAMTQEELNKTSGILKVTADSLVVTERIAKIREMQVELRNSQLKERESQIAYQKKINLYIIIGVIGVVMFLIVVLILLRQKLNDNKKLKHQNVEIERQKSEIEHQKDKLDRQNKHITSSITYAQTIQQAILPAKENMDHYCESFILYRPKDIVSGDFYWFSPFVDNKGLKKFFIAVVDCTGHGVPGAFMSLIGSRMLNEIVKEKELTDTSEILVQLNANLRNALKQEATDNNDGMDLALCLAEEQADNTYLITYSGAKRPLYFYKSGASKIESVDATRVSIGGRNAGKAKIIFEKHQLIFQKGDVLILSSDGIIDQNGPDRLRFGSQRFTETLFSNIHLSMNDQKFALEKALDYYVRNEDQRDDITVLAFKLI